MGASPSRSDSASFFATISFLIAHQMTALGVTDDHHRSPRRRAASSADTSPVNGADAPSDRSLARRRDRCSMPALRHELVARTGK
jgi:hypothetical protein